MTSRHLFQIVASTVALAISASAVAQTRPALPSTQPAGLTVAVLPFAAGSAEPDSPLGSQVAELVAIGLSGRPGIVLVERASLAKVLEEQALGRSGLVEGEQAVKVGRLVGARILVTGKVYTIDDQTMMTAKVIGVETSRVEAALVKESGRADLSRMATNLAEQISGRLAAAGAELIGEPADRLDPLPRLKAALRDRKLPVVAVIISERHIASVPAAPDPAVETEVKRLLIDCGFRVQDVRDNELADFARRLPERSTESWPRSLDGVDVVIAGEGLSEMGARIGNFTTCSARAELNMIERASGKILLAERTTQRAADLSESLAAKEALAKAGRALGLAVLEHFAGAGVAPSDERSNAKSDLSPQRAP